MTKKPLIYRQNMKFYIDQAQIKPEFRKVNIINALYGAMYLEFKGAIHNDKYKNLTPMEKIQKINDFARGWLEKRGFI